MQAGRVVGSAKLSVQINKKYVVRLKVLMRADPSLSSHSQNTHDLKQGCKSINVCPR